MTCTQFLTAIRQINLSRNFLFFILHRLHKESPCLSMFTLKAFEIKRFKCITDSDARFRELHACEIELISNLMVCDQLWDSCKSQIQLKRFYSPHESFLMREAQLVRCSFPESGSAKVQWAFEWKWNGNFALRCVILMLMLREFFRRCKNPQRIHWLAVHKYLWRKQPSEWVIIVELLQWDFLISSLVCAVLNSPTKVLEIQLFFSCFISRFFQWH